MLILGTQEMLDEINSGGTTMVSLRRPMKSTKSTQKSSDSTETPKPQTKEEQIEDIKKVISEFSKKQN